MRRIIRKPRVPTHSAERESAAYVIRKESVTNTVCTSMHAVMVLSRPNFSTPYETTGQPAMLVKPVMSA